MPEQDRRILRERLQELSEEAVRCLLVGFFWDALGEAVDLHGSGEHGIDIAVRIRPDRDPVGKGQYLLVQVKRGDITSSTWRNDVSGQLQEASRFPLRRQHHSFTEILSRRLLLVATGCLTPEARRSVVEYNAQNELVVEVFELDHLVDWLIKNSYSEYVIGSQEFVGQPPSVEPDAGEVGVQTPNGDLLMPSRFRGRLVGEELPRVLDT